MNSAIDIKTINLISEYIKTPVNDIYRDLLYKKISEDKSALECLKSQEAVLSEMKTIDAAIISGSTFSVIQNELTKIAAEKSQKSQQQIAMDFITLKNFTIAGLVALTGLLFYFAATDFFKNNTNQASVMQDNSAVGCIENKIISQSFGSNNENVQKIQNSENTENLKLNDIVSFVGNNDGNYANKNEEIYGYSGNIKDYKTIQDVDKNLDMLSQAEKEIDSSVVDLDKVDGYIYRTQLSGHKVDVIIEKEEK